MDPEVQEHRGHRIQIRPRGVGEMHTAAEDQEVDFELLIDDEPVHYGRLADGSYALHEYAYDWQPDLMSLARRFIDYRDQAQATQSTAESDED